MTHLRAQLQDTIAQALVVLYAPEITPEQAVTLAVLETPKLAAHGDFACTAAMQLAKVLRQKPYTLAQALQGQLLEQPLFKAQVQALEIAGAGFLNLTLTCAARQSVVQRILREQERFGYQPYHGRKVLVEFVSANPTGPLHVGHGRQAALGDTICNLYTSQGWQAVREFYYNDTGAQIHNLALSVQARAQGLCPSDAGWPDNGYNGEYIGDIAQAFLQKQTVHADDRSYQANGDADDLEAIRLFAVAYLRHEQDLDLQAFGLRFDNYFLESDLYTSKAVESTVATLVAQGHTYEDEGALWLKTTNYGDDKDRVMRKSNGYYTYFVPDVAYHKNKWERGFAQAVNIQGSDHHSTVIRVRAGLQALDSNIPQNYPDYVLHTMVRVARNGEEIKLSKRTGDYVSLRDLIGWTSADAVRFFLLSRKPDTEYIFDVDLALAQHNNNPVYYVQYAHARICSVLTAWGGDTATLIAADLAPLRSTVAQGLLRTLGRYPHMLSMATRDFAPHDLVFYLRELAANYHSYYDAEHILVRNESERLARLALVAATAQVLRNGLALLGVSAPEKM